MRIVLQRVARARVTVGDETVAAIGPGLLLLIAVASNDDEAVCSRMAQKCVEMRLFAGDGGRFDRSLLDAGGEALVVSQFTLLASVRKGRRPSFTDAAPAELAAPLVEHFVAALSALGLRTKCGRFGATMHVESVNDGPVTIILDSADLDRPRRYSG